MYPLFIRPELAGNPDRELNSPLRIGAA